VPAPAADYTVATGTTDTTTKPVTGTDTLTIQSGGTLAVTGANAVTWTAPSAAPGILIDNFGNITSTVRAIDTSGSNTPRNMTLNNAATGVISSTDDAFRINNTIGNGTVVINNSGLFQSDTGQVFDFASNTSATGAVQINNSATGIIKSLGNDAIRTGLGAVAITNSGLIDATESVSRAINLNTGNLNNLVSLQIFNHATGIIQSIDDTIRVTGSNATTTSGIFTIDNAGIIQSIGTGGLGGQAIDFNDLNSPNAAINIINRATGVISAEDADAIRPGLGATVTNYGRITTNGIFETATDRPAGNDAIDLQSKSAAVINKTGGVIDGFRHGVTAGTGANVTVTNEAGATIIGRNGSGVGSDGTGTVVNYGLIRGDNNGGSGRNVDGDGVDIDLAATILNYGTIRGTGASGFDANGRANNSEGVSIGGGTIDNYGLISGAGRGIIVNNDSNPDNSRSGVAATTVTNYASGTIVGLNGYAIRLENKTGTSADNDTIVNYGTIIGNGAIPDPNEVVLLQNGNVDSASVGTLDGVTYTGTGLARFIRGEGSAVQMGQGNDALTNYGVITGNNGRAINLEGGNGTLNIMPGSKITGLVNGGADTDTLNFNKVGLTEQKRAALQAGQTVNIGGTPYTSFEIVNGTAHSYSSFATNPNALNVARVIDNGSTVVGGNSATVALLDTIATSANVGAALNQLTPAIFQNYTTIGINTGLQVTQLVGQRLDSIRQHGLGFSATGLDAVASIFERSQGGSVASAFSATDTIAASHSAFAALDRKRGGDVPVMFKAPEHRSYGESEWGLFLNGNAFLARQGAIQNLPASKSKTATVTAGVDRRVSDDLVVGFLAGFSRTNADLDTFGSTSKITTAMLGTYGTYDSGSWFANAAFLYGRNSYDTTRMAVGTSNVSSASGNQFVAYGGLGTNLRSGGWLVTPEAGLQYTAVQVGAFSEIGAAALRVDQESANSLRSNVGVRVQHDITGGWGKVTPELRAAWQHEFLDNTRAITASFVDAALPGAFETTTVGMGRDFGIVGAGLSATLGLQSVVSFNYDYKFGGDDFSAHLIAGRFRYFF
jgi:outer membrane autotransporter protein